ncbi:MAG: hypothetical protein A2X05_00425 [Bacteroidetes bacterium GWE2_41_25]|nr:MAG: hypothetical protein A2X03_11175 [Bacteroidetes bacterium GWA2_40_15]OFX96452.1 MAG: hypothetical protein A2X06_16200 [Bacteroidetes bacterium GWC2_40_22]OFX97139.1 MAG: hypothetical protein A2X05_00425 [Bacteroidetes bacterium GWE2_41_25]HBH82590.1 hypothetical protein [Bacteroidales bacterium]HBQ81701.1 hypothetical protein [Bacteroidales bacterium]
MKNKANSGSNAFNRRKFISMAGIGAATLTVSPRYVLAGEQASTRKIRLGIIGGGFGTSFFFHEHPNCTVFEN